MTPNKQPGRIPLLVFSGWLIFAAPPLIIAGIIAAFFIGWKALALCALIAFGVAGALLLFAVQVIIFAAVKNHNQPQPAQQNQGWPW